MLAIPNLKQAGLVSLLTALCSCTHLQNEAPQTESEPPQTLWRLDHLGDFGAAGVSVEGDPTLVTTAHGPAIHFDGDGDRLVVDDNPLDQATQFTIELWFKPDNAWPDNWQPRFFHIEAPDNPNRRVTVELRLNDQSQWYLDGFIKSESDDLTLIDDSLVHSVDEWHHAALTYDGSTLRSYVNGTLELEGAVHYDPISDEGMTSIGARMNRVHWFKGTILAARVTQAVLPPEAFLSVEELSQP